MEDAFLKDTFYRTVDQFIQLVGAKGVSESDIFFRVSRCAIGTDIDYSEVRRILGGITSFAAWYTAWKASADRFAALAAEAEAHGHRITAGEHWLRAALLAHFAQLFTRPEDPRRREGQAARVRWYRQAAPLLDPPVEPVAIPFGSHAIPGYLRLPAGITAPVPVVLMIPGANSVKEELHNWGAAILKRGMATLAFDGPGQGELSVRNGGMPCRLETVHETIGAVIDYALTRSEIDRERIGLLGQSTGGNMALGAAAREHRLRALASLAGGYDFRGKRGPNAPVDVREEACDLYGLEGFGELEAYLARAGSLAGRIGEIRCPILLIGGGMDKLVSRDELETIRTEARVPVDLLWFDDANHSVCNRNLEMAGPMADWLADRLLR